MVKFIEVLKNKNFSLLWGGQIISRFGDRLNQMALIALISSRAPGSTFELAKLLSFTIIPVFVIGPIAGVYIDRWDRKRTMVTCDILRGLLVLLIPLSFIYWEYIFPIYIVVFMIFSITRFFLTSQLSIIPDIVSSEKLLTANSLNTLTRIIATIISFGVGGILVAIVGTRGGFYIDSATYFVSAIMLSLIIFNKDIVQKEDQEEKEKKKKSVFKEIKDGIRYIFKDKSLHFPMLIMFSLMAGAGAIYTVLIVFIQEHLHSVTKDVGLVAMFSGIGLLIGAILFNKWGGKKSKQKVMFGSLIASGLAIVLFAILISWTESFPVAAITSIILGITISPIIIGVQTLIHEIVPEKLRGRIFSSLEIIIHFAFVVFMIISSLIADIIAPMWVLIWAGVLLVILGNSCLLYLKKK